MNSESLRASDSDRDKVAEVLHTAFAEGRITYEEHIERMESVLASKTFGELMAITADLLPTTPTGYSPSAALVPPQDYGDEPDRITAALSEVKRVGKWRVRRQSQTNTFMGSVYLDLTEADFDASVVELSGTQFMGSLFLRVPPGTNIRDETTSVMGSTSIKDIGEPNPSFPTVVIRGTNVMSEIKVRGPKKPPIWKRAIA